MKIKSGGKFNDYILDLVCSVCGKKYKYIYKNGTSSGSSKQRCNSCHANSGRFIKKDRMISTKVVNAKFVAIKNVIGL